MMDRRQIFLAVFFFAFCSFGAPNDIVNCVNTTKLAGMSREEILDLCQYAPSSFPYQCYLLAQKAPYELKQKEARALCRGALNRGGLTCFLKTKAILPEATDLELANLCNWTND